MHVRTSVLLLLGATALAQAPDVANPPKSAVPEPPKLMGTIHQKELLGHATFLASDELKGRLTGSPGQLAAADYIAAHFATLGLEPLGDEIDGKRGFRQHYGIARTYVAADTKLQLGGMTLTDGFAVLGGKSF